MGKRRTTIDDLRLKDRGRAVIVEDKAGQWSMTGMLRDVETHTDQIDVRDITSVDVEYVDGTSTTTIRVGPWSATGLPDDTPVWVEGS